MKLVALLASTLIGCLSDHRVGNDAPDARPGDDGAFAWSLRAPLPLPRTGLGTAAVGGKVYALGGYTGSMVARVDEYDPASDQWTRKADMHSARRDFAVGVIDGKIYAGPGTSSGSLVAGLEVYDPATDTWADRAPCPIGAVLMNNFFVGGGAANGQLFVVVWNNNNPTGNSPTTFTYAYDPASDSWSSRAPVPFADTQFAVAAQGGLLYVFGSDYYAGGKLASYSPLDDIWVVRAMPPAWRSAFVAANGKLYAFSGVTGDVTMYDTTPAVNQYDPATEMWTPSGAIQVAREYASAAELAGHVFVIGGDTASPGGPPSAVVEEGVPR